MASQAIQVQLHELTVLPRLPIRVPSITYNIHYFVEPGCYAMIDVPPLFHLQLSAEHNVNPLTHIFLTSHFNTEALPALVRQYPGVKIYCTNQCAGFLRRMYAGISANIVVQTQEPVVFKQHAFYSIPTPLAPFPTSQFIYERFSRTLFTHFHFSQAGGTSQVNFRAEIQMFQQAFLPGVLRFQKRLLAAIQAQKGVFERVCPQYGRDWFRSEFQRLEAQSEPRAATAVLLLYSEAARGVAMRAHRQLSRHLACVPVCADVLDAYELFRHTQDAYILVAASALGNAELEPKIVEALSLLKQYRPFSVFVGLLSVSGAGSGGEDEKGEKEAEKDGGGENEGENRVRNRGGSSFSIGTGDSDAQTAEALFRRESEELDCEFAGVFAANGSETQLVQLIGRLKALRPRAPVADRFGFLDKALERFFGLLKAEQM